PRRAERRGERSPASSRTCWSPEKRRRARRNITRTGIQDRTKAIPRTSSSSIFASLHRRPHAAFVHSAAAVVRETALAAARRVAGGAGEAFRVGERDPTFDGLLDLGDAGVPADDQRAREAPDALGEIARTAARRRRELRAARSRNRGERPVAPLLLGGVELD